MQQRKSTCEKRIKGAFIDFNNSDIEDLDSDTDEELDVAEALQSLERDNVDEFAEQELRESISYPKQQEESNFFEEEAVLEQREGIIDKSKKRREYIWRKCDWNSPQDSNFILEEPHEIGDEISPLDYFLKYFTPELIEAICRETNQKYLATNGKCLNLSLEELYRLIAMEILLGSCGFPRIKMYYNKATKIPGVANTMAIKRFHNIRHHLCFSQEENEIDKLWKIRPIITAVNSRCRQLQKQEFLSADEMMIPFKRRTALKMYMPKKPHKWGIKIFVLCGSDGVVYDMEIYAGKNTKVGKDNLGFCSDIILRLVETVPIQRNYKIMFDNYFTTLPLLEKLRERNIWGTGTVRQNRLAKVPLKTEGELKKEGRGSVDYRITNDIITVRWYDSGVV